MVNKVILMGYVGKDPVIRRLDNNLVKAEFTLATTERWIKDGNRMEHTEWFNISLWRNLAEIAEKYVRKGSLIYVEGKLNTRSYDDKDGNKRFVIEVIADSMKLVGSKPESGHTTETPIGGISESASIVEPPLESGTEDLPF